MSLKIYCLQSQKEAVEELRHRITSNNCLDKQKLECHNFLLRYLKFHRLDVSKAEKSIKSYYKYIQSGKQKEVLTIEAPAEYKDHFQIYGGARDYKNRPVVQIPNVKDWNLHRIIDKDDEQLIKMLVKKMHWYLEKELLETDSEFAVVVVDLKDIPYTFSLAKRIFNVCIELCRELMPVSPDVVGRCIILNAPKIVKVLNAAGQSLLRLSQEQRNQCIIFSPGDNDWKERVLDFIPEDQLRPEFGGTFTGHQILH